ncbi:hypothetical protein SARC_07268 [Sphaeroforma arctica JP610]|uniref:Phytanoyl-CoA dioxygenase n=1 Tax=Sphaeroforma arctica JP610 TaxID=667725 RepID=A0A0L0FWN7_9EUKA|nr:hypothetical protein SARC_07268 [Sphaeroforma arctica JP610]KNC80368.1 hypothetical protein SARC_07268 [Sphaeroforma arctica JP610]|eukprot:XP_014154270.1 hypothetical protein SARC_07268 [Sphaeroforma arctica JP610]
MADQRTILHRDGVLIIENACSPESFEQARLALRDAYDIEVLPYLKEGVQDWAKGRSIFELAANKNAWPTGVIGNKSFGFMYMQPEKKADSLVAKVGGHDVIFQTLCSDKANRILINHESNTNAKRQLLALSDEDENTTIAIDSCKVYRGDLSIPHYDLYDDELKRMQAMVIGPNEGNVRLCFLKGSHTKTNKNKKGFVKIDNPKEEFKHSANKGKVMVPPLNSLVVWLPGVIHGEVMVKNNPIKSESDYEFRNNSKAGVERYITPKPKPSEENCRIRKINTVYGTS